MLENLGVKDPVQVRYPEDLASLDGLILPGGESTTISKLLTSTGVGPALQGRIENQMPVFGTCAGMILLAQKSIGGISNQIQLNAIDLGVKRNAYGPQLESFETDITIPVLGKESFPAIFIRSPIVQDVGTGVDVLAEYKGQPVLCQSGSTLTAAFHPELSSDNRLHQYFLDLITRSS